MPLSVFFLLHQQEQCFILCPKFKVKIQVVDTRAALVNPDPEELQFHVRSPWSHLVFQTVHWHESQLEVISTALEWYGRNYADRHFALYIPQPTVKDLR